MSKKTERKAIDKVFILLGIASTGLMLVVGALSWYGSQFALNMVHDELSMQQIYFPEKDSEAFRSLPAKDQEAVGRFAGQQLVTGEQAKVYANNYIGVHLQGIGGGKTYAQISSDAASDPANEELQAKKTALFQGETLRGMLLGTGYAFWIFGMIALYVSIAAFAGAVVMAILVILGMRHLSKLG